ncbi:MAG: endolytic transglycosylase MltG [Pseudomonadota bacterium]|nr:endolytic transglycosylase MltG [Pseudomonadota bacterium]
MADLRAKRSERGGAVRSVVIFTLILALLASISIGVGGYFAWREAARPGPLREPAVVLLLPGSSVARIAAELEASGAIRNAQLFTAAARVKGVQSSLKAGEYKIPAEASVLEILDLLVEGKTILHSFTAPEGRTTAQILRLIETQPMLMGEITLTPGEGELLPETYHFSRGETRDGMIRTMMKAQDELLDSIWDERALDLPFNTRKDAIILASIVEKETGIPEERARIAAVFVNRLKRGMRLESDPTIIYGLTKGEPLGRGLRLSELRGETPYNTYVINGLPPTPIANPGRGAIEAVLNPADTDDIFFVADGSGGHAFASSLEEHNRNVAKWRRVERAQQGGK